MTLSSNIYELFLDREQEAKEVLKFDAVDTQQHQREIENSSRATSRASENVEGCLGKCAGMTVTEWRDHFQRSNTS